MSSPQPMQLVNKEDLQQALQPYEGRQIYIYAEVNPGAFLRNVYADVVQTYAAGEGPYRVALRLQHGGWVRVEGITHMTRAADGALLLAGHDDRGRITTALQLSDAPFDFERGAEA